MTTEQIINLDFRKEENKIIIQKVLRKIKPLSRYSDEYDIPLDAIEKAITIMSKKYEMHISHMNSDYCSNKEYIIWRLSIYDDRTLVELNSIHAVSVYELFAKIAICMYAHVKRRKKEDAN